MARYLTITVGDAKGRVRLLEDEAPEMCKAVLAILPIEDMTVPVRWSGNAWRSDKDYDLPGPQVENRPEALKAGDIAFYPNLKKICFAYARAQWKGPYGEIRDMTLFAQVEDGLKELVDASEHAHVHGTVKFTLKAE